MFYPLGQNGCAELGMAALQEILTLQAGFPPSAAVREQLHCIGSAGERRGIEHLPQPDAGLNPRFAHQTGWG